MTTHPQSPEPGPEAADLVGELDDLVEHLERFRATTLQVLELVDDDELAWRPGEEQYSLGQQLLHIAQAEERFVRGLFHDDWSLETVRLPKVVPGRDELKRIFHDVRHRTLAELRELDPEALSHRVHAPESPVPLSLRSWLWFVLEHELHHRGQVWAYLRSMGKVPPFYAIPLPLGERPDIDVRERLGGF